MDGPSFTRNDALAGLQQLAQTPLARGAVRYWWVTLPVAALGWHYYAQRKKEGKATVGQLVHDMVPVVGLVGTLLTLNTLLARRETAPAAPKPPLPVGSIKDADFTPVAASIAS